MLTLTLVDLLPVHRHALSRLLNDGPGPGEVWKMEVFDNLIDTRRSWRATRYLPLPPMPAHAMWLGETEPGARAALMRTSDGAFVVLEQPQGPNAGWSTVRAHLVLASSQPWVQVPSWSIDPESPLKARRAALAIGQWTCEQASVMQVQDALRFPLWARLFDGSTDFFGPDLARVDSAVAGLTTMENVGKRWSEDHAAAQADWDEALRTREVVQALIAKSWGDPG